jgi:hypothetical protein
MNYYTTSTPVTCSAPPSNIFQRTTSEKDLVAAWFIDPLNRMKEDDAFVCMMVCFPLIEAIIRHEYNIPDQNDVKFSENSEPLKWFSRFASIPEAQARSIWDCCRNGLLHRAMLKDDTDYELSPAMPGRVAEFKDGKIYLYVWELRTAVVDLIKKHGKKLWKDSSTPLPRVYFR